MTLQTKIRCRYRGVDKDGNLKIEVVKTTPGRMLLSQILPRHPNVPFALINRLLTKKDVQNVIDVVYRHCGQKETVIFADRLMAMGFASRLPRGHLVRQGRHDHPGRQEAAGRADQDEGRRSSSSSTRTA